MKIQNRDIKIQNSEHIGVNQIAKYPDVIWMNCDKAREGARVVLKPVGDLESGVIYECTDGKWKKL